MMTVKSGIFLQLVGASEPVDFAANELPCVEHKATKTPAKCDYHHKAHGTRAGTTYCYTEPDAWANMYRFCRRKGHNDFAVNGQKCDQTCGYLEDGRRESITGCTIEANWWPYKWQDCQLKDVTEEVSEDTTAVKEDTPTTTKEPKLI